MVNLTDCIENDVLSYRGKYTKLFEEKIKTYTKSKYVVSTNTGTSSLFISLLLSKIGSGDNVIIPCLSFVGTANAVSYTGAKPIFVDINKDYLIDIDKLKSYLDKNYTKNIKAIIPVHLFGRVCDMKAINKIAKEYNLKVIEDACQSLGSTYNNRHAGTFGDFGCLSFNGNKILTTGGGGMILTQSKANAEKARHLVTTGKVDKIERNFHNCLAYNFGMPSVNAALGIDNMVYFKDKITRNRVNYLKLSRKFDTLYQPDNTTSNFWMQIIKADKRPDIDCKPLYTLLPDLPMYEDCICDNIDYARSIENKTWMIDNEVYNK